DVVWTGVERFVLSVFASRALVSFNTPAAARTNVMASGVPCMPIPLARAAAGVLNEPNVMEAIQHWARNWRGVKPTARLSSRQKRAEERRVGEHYTAPV